MLCLSLAGILEQAYDAKLTELWGGPPPKHYPRLWEAWPAEHGPRVKGKVAIVTGGAAGTWVRRVLENSEDPPNTHTLTHPHAHKRCVRGVRATTQLAVCWHVLLHLCSTCHTDGARPSRACTPGIGFYITKMLVHLGADVIVPWRAGFEEETAAAVAAISAACGEASGGGGSVRMSKAPLDLMSFASVRKFAASCREELSQIDLLCLNAGRGGSKGDPIEVTADGCEAIVQVNALSHFLLTAELFPLLRASPEARIVSQSSGARKLFTPASKVPQRLRQDLNAANEGDHYDAFSQCVPARALLCCSRSTTVL